MFGLGVGDTVWINIQYDPYQPRRWLDWQEFEAGVLLLRSLFIGRPDDLTIEVIGITPDNTIWRNAAPVYALDQWSGWQPFGAPGDQFRTVTALRTGGPDGSESDVFGLAPDDTIWRRAPGSNAWVRFGDPGDLLSTITPIWNTNGLALGVAGTAPDHTIWHAALLPSGQWGPLQRFGSDGDRLRQLTFARGNDFRMHAFGINPDEWRCLAQVPDDTWGLAAAIATGTSHGGTPNADLARGGVPVRHFGDVRPCGWGVCSGTPLAVALAQLVERHQGRVVHT